MKYPVSVRVRRPEMELLPSVAYLDIPKLAKAAEAEVALGSIKTGCCGRQVSAVIRKGKVVGFRVEGCSAAKPPTPDTARLLKAAQKLLGGSAPQARFRPIPVGQFFGNEGGLTIEVFFCIEICCFGRCLLCCISSDGGNTGCAGFDDPL